MNDNCYGRIKIATELLLEALSLPSGTRIVSVKGDDFDKAQFGVIELIVEHPSFRPLTDGQVHVGGSCIPDMQVICQVVACRYEIIDK